MMMMNDSDDDGDHLIGMSWLKSRPQSPPCCTCFLGSTVVGGRNLQGFTSSEVMGRTRKSLVDVNECM